MNQKCVKYLIHISKLKTIFGAKLPQLGDFFKEPCECVRAVSHYLQCE